MGEFESIKLISSIARRAADGDGLSAIDRIRVASDHARMIRKPHLRRALNIFSDLVITKNEREELLGRLGHGPAFQRKLDELIGKDGRGLLRKQVSFFAQRAKQTQSPRERVAACISINQRLKYAHHVSAQLYEALRREHHPKAAALCAATLIRILKPNIQRQKIQSAIIRHFLSGKNFIKYPGLRNNAALVLKAMQRHRFTPGLPSALLMRDIKFLARTILNKPEFIHRVAPPLRRNVVAWAFGIALAQGKGISWLLATLPHKLMRDKELMLPLFKRCPQYLALVAPQLTRFPISLALLAFRFGITFGRRFPNDEALATIVDNHLLAKYDVYDPRPLAVMIYPKSDWNAAFRALKETIRLMNKGYYVRYYEAETESDVVSALKDATTRRKASLLILGGHGDKKSLSLGAPDPRKGKRLAEQYYIDTSDMRDLRGLTNRLVDGAHIVLEACSNGRGGRNADNMLNFISRMFPQAYVHAQMAPGSLNATFDQKGLFVGTTNSKGVKSAVIRRRTGFYKEYEPAKNFESFPHPRHTSRATAEGRLRKLRDIERGHPDHLVRLAAGHQLGIKSWGNKRIVTKDIMIASLIDTMIFDSMIREHEFWLLALDALTKMGMSAAPPLVAALRNTNPSVQLGAVKGLIKIMGQRFVPWLVGAWERIHVSVRIKVMNQLAPKMGPQAVSLLEKAIKDPSPSVRVLAAIWLVNLKDHRYLHMILKAIKGSDKDASMLGLLFLDRIRNPKAVPALIAALKDSNTKIRHAAIGALGQIKDRRSIPALIAASRDKDALVRSFAVMYLADMKDPRVIPALTAVLKDGDSRVRRGGFNALEGLKNRRSVPALIEALKSSDHTIRRQAIKVLKKIKGPRVVPALISVLEKDGNHDVRRDAAEALSEIRDPKSISALVAATKDSHPLVRISAARALVLMKHRKYKRVIIAALKDKQSRVCFVAARILSEMGDHRAVSVYLDVLKGGKKFMDKILALRALRGTKDPRAIATIIHTALKDREKVVRLASLWILRDLKSPKVVGTLVAMLKDKYESVRLDALLSLATLKDRSSVPAIIIALRDPDSRVRGAAATALGYIKDATAVTALTKVLGGEGTPSVRREAALALGKIGSRAAVSSLIRALMDYNPVVRMNAAKALGKIRDRRAVPALITTMVNWHSNVWVRIAAAKALERFNDPRAKRALRKAGFLGGK